MGLPTGSKPSSPSLLPRRVADAMVHEFVWKAPKDPAISFITRVRDYTASQPLIVLEHHFPDGISATGNGDRSDVSTRFPTFEGEPEVPLGFMTYAGNMACPDTVLQCTWQGRYNAEQWGLLPGGISGGVPLALFDNSSAQNTLVLSPASEFMAASQARVNASRAMAFGLMGTYDFIPPGFTLSTMVFAGSGVSATMEGWGALLRRRYHKSRQASRADFTVNHLSFYTDNGG